MSQFVASDEQLHLEPTDFTTRVMEGKKRSREHIENTLCSEDSLKPTSQKVILDELTNVYKACIQPLEEAYKFSVIKGHHNAVAEINAKPSLLFLGPWSSGKTTMINHLLGLEGRHSLRTGVEPTSSDFVIIDKGNKRKTLAGTALIANALRPFKPLEQYGMGLAARLQGLEIPSKALEQLSIIDTPGILESSDQQKRGYPYSDVCQWFINRASLIFFVFDPSKLDAGKQLHDVFRKLKGHEGKLRIILNKADAIDSLTLLRTYGAFCWNLRSLVPKLAEPPRVYMVSFWSEPLKVGPYSDVILSDEKALVQDIKDSIDNHIETAISMLLVHAQTVETHAIIVNSYLDAFNDSRHWWLRWRNGALQSDVVECPDLFDIPQRVGARTSRHDGFLNVLTYRRFFQAHSLGSFYNVSQNRGGVLFAGNTVLERAQEAINKTIPNLLNKQRAQRVSMAERQVSNTNDTSSLTGRNILENTLKRIRAPREQLNNLIEHGQLSSLWMATPLSFITQKVQGALKNY